jgi:hypothetical protein
MKYKYNLSTITCFRNELPFLEEWIKYHQYIGVEHFYLANNDLDKAPANHLLLPYIKKGIVTLLPEISITFGQWKSMPKLLELAKGESKWVAAIDIDEFIYPQKQNKNIYEEIILDFERAGIRAIGLNWALFGCSNIALHQNLVTQSYFRRAYKFDKFNSMIKFIFRPEEVSECKGHSFIFHRDWLVVNTLYQQLKIEDNKYKTEEINWAKLRLNHYPIKSLEDFLNKVHRGYLGKLWTPRNNKFWSKYFADYNKNDEKDLGMLFASKIFSP